VKYLGVGTNLKFYIENGETYYDITPIREVTAAGDVTFAATDGSDIIVVTDVGFGSNVGDFVSFSGVDPDGLGANGNITQAVLEQEFQIATVIDSDNYTIVAVTANVFDVGDGGPNVVGTYEIPVGNENAAAIYGWGAGFWDSGSWNEELTSNSTFRVWNQQNFGQDLVFGPNGGPEDARELAADCGGGKQAGRRRHHWQQPGGQGTGRWLHRVVQHRGAGAANDLDEAALRPDQGFCSDQPRGHQPQRVGRIDHAACQQSR
jgi:hypothetical protein